MLVKKKLKKVVKKSITKLDKKDRKVQRALDTLDALEEMGRARNVKIELMEKRKKNKYLLSIFTASMDTGITYGYIPEATEGLSTDTMDGGYYDRYKKFRKILKKLASRKLSGNAAKREVSRFLKRVSKQESRWYRRVLRRDLRIGVAFKTFDKVWTGHLKLYTVQLALEYPKVIPPFPCVGEPKYDGIRMIIELENGVGVVRSRNGKEYTNLQFLADRLLRVVDNVALDAEIMAKTWNETSSLIRSLPENLTTEQTKKLKQIKMFSIDLIPIEGFRRGQHPHTDSRRRNDLKRVLKKLKTAGVKNFKLIPRYPIEDQSDIEQLSVDLIGQGHEGVMLKDPNAPYEPANYRDARVPHWLKVKPWEDKEGIIIGMEEGKKGKKNEGKLGAWVVEMSNGDVVRVGGGLKDTEREKFWELGPDPFVGKTLEFAQQKDVGTLIAKARFPQYKRIRNVEDE